MHDVIISTPKPNCVPLEAILGFFSVLGSFETNTLCFVHQEEGDSGPIYEISLDKLQASQADTSGTQAPTDRWQASGKQSFFSPRL